MSDRRFPRKVFAGGTEPDPRFTLANERTFLAWIRTALALVAGGLAVEAFALPIQPGLRQAASVALLVLGLAVPVLAWLGWCAMERAMRHDEPLPSSRIAPLLTVGLTGVTALLLVGLFLA